MDSEPQRRRWHLWIILFFVIGIVLYAGISYLVVSQLKPKPKASSLPRNLSFSSPAPTTTPSVLIPDQLKQEIKKAKTRALEKPERRDPDNNFSLKWSKEYQITYLGRDDRFYIHIFTPKLDETRKAAEDYLIHQLLKTDDKQVLCAINMKIVKTHYADPAGKVNWGPFTKLSVCDGGQSASLLDKLVPKAYAAACDVWESAYYCSCAFLQPYFGNRTWAARLIGARESACNPSVMGPNGEAGIFQIYPGGSYDPGTNASQAVAKSGGGTNFGQWTTCSFRNANDCTGQVNVCAPGPDPYNQPSSCAPPTFNVSGFVYRDNNENGIPDGGDWPLPNVWMNLEGVGGGATNGGGGFRFANMPAGYYNLYVSIPANYHATTPWFIGIRGGPDTYNEFGLALNPFDISGAVWKDNNRNGLMDVGDQQFGGVWINLGGVGGGATASNGSYIFRNIRAGTYNVFPNIPSTYSPTTASVISVTGPPNITGINFGLAENSVAGSVFLDYNKNGFKDAGESNYTDGPITISSSRGNVTTNANGTYYINNLNAGAMTVSYTSLPVADYFMTYPLNGPPPTFSVSVGGSGCSTGGANGANCLFGSVQNLNFGISNLYPWVQSTCGSVRLDSGITNRIPQNPVGGPYFIINNSACSNPGIAHMGDSSYSLGKGIVSISQWLVGGASYPETYKPPVSGSKTSYAYVNTKAQQNSIPSVDLATVCSLNNCTLPSNLPHGLYRANGNVTLNSFRAPADQDYMFLINGTLTLEDPIIVPTGSTVFFSVARDITVSPSLGVPANSSVASLQGIYSTDTSFLTPSAGTCVDQRLNIGGSVITNAGGTGGSFQNRRDLCGSGANYPSISFIQRPDFIFNLPELLKIQNTVTWEAAP